MVKNDSHIIEECIKGDQKAQKKLYDLYCGQMYSICLRYCKDSHSAMDALQNGFIRVFKNLKQYRNDGSLGGWIRKIVVRSALDQIKIDKSVFHKEIDELTDGLEWSTTLDIDFDDYNYQKMMALINELPYGYRMIFSLFVLDDMSHVEIAQSLGITQATSRSQLMKARRMLQKKIKEDAYLVSQYFEKSKI